MQKSFADTKLDMEEACEFLRSFTLGRHGFSARSGMTGIKRVNIQCKRLERLYSSGPDARESKILVLAAGCRIRAAESRLELLRKK